MSNVFLNLELETPGTFTLVLGEEGDDITELMTFDYSDSSRKQYNAVVPSGSTLWTTSVVTESNDYIPYSVRVSATNVGNEDIWMTESWDNEKVIVAPGMSIDLEFFSEPSLGYRFGNG